MDPNTNMAAPGPMSQPQPTPMTNPTFPPSTPSADKGDKPFKIATIIASVIALAGIGFGAYGMIKNSQKDTDISNLKTQVQNLNNAPAAANDNTLDNTTPDDTATTENTQDYIYISDWGIKIKKPENYVNLINSYKFYNGYPQAVDDFTITPFGADAADISLYRLKNKTCEEVSEINTITCFVLGDYTYVVQQLVEGFDSSKTAPEELLNFFKNVENYTEI